MIVHDIAPSENKFALFNTRISAGFPSPADNYISKRLSLDELVIAHPNTTFFAQVVGDSMIEAGIAEGDYAVFDKSVLPTHNKVVIASVDGEFTIKRYVKIRNKIFLNPENKKYNAIEITGEMNASIEGVVIAIIKKNL